MQDVSDVSCRESFRDPQRQRGGSHRRLRPIVLDQFPQRAASHELHLQKIEPQCLADRMDRDDVRVVERRRCAPFIGKTLDVCGITLHQTRRQDFQRTLPMQVEMTSQIDAAHRSRTEQCVARIAVDTLADQLINFMGCRGIASRSRRVRGSGDRVMEMRIATGTRIQVEAATAAGTDLNPLSWNKRELTTGTERGREQSRVWPGAAVFGHG